MDDTGVRFGLLWGDAHLAVRAYIRSLVGDPVATDDLVQEVALAAFRSFHTYDHARGFTGWALGVARHLVHQHWSDRFRQRSVIHDLAIAEEMAQLGAEVDDMAEREREALRICLESVHGRNWEVMRRHYVDGESTDAIADHLGLAVGHIRVLMHRIRTALRSCIERRLADGAAHD